MLIRVVSVPVCARVVVVVVVRTFSERQCLISLSFLLSVFIVLGIFNVESDADMANNVHSHEMSPITRSV